MRSLSCKEKKTTALSFTTKSFLLYAHFLFSDRLSSKFILGSFFLALLYPFSTIMGLVLIYVKHKFSLSSSYPPIPKDIYLLKEIFIFKEGITDRVEPVTDDISDAIDLAQKH